MGRGKQKQIWHQAPLWGKGGRTPSWLFMFVSLFYAAHLTRKVIVVFLEVFEICIHNGFYAKMSKIGIFLNNSTSTIFHNIIFYSQRVVFSGQQINIFCVTTICSVGSENKLGWLQCRSVVLPKGKFFHHWPDLRSGPSILSEGPAAPAQPHRCPPCAPPRPHRDPTIPR